MKKVAILLSIIINVNGQSLMFNGNDDYVDMGTPSNLLMDYVTVSAWVYPDWDGNYDYIVSRETGYVLRNEGNNLAFVVTLNNTVEYYDTYTTLTNKNEWAHVVGTYDGETSKLYVNGVLKSSDDSPSGKLTIDSSSPFRIGNAYCCQNRGFKGNIDEVAIWDEALSAVEVAALYNSGYGINAVNNSGDYTSSSNLQGYWKMNEGTGSILADGSNNNNLGNIYGATWSDDTVINPNSPTSFDWVSTALDTVNITQTNTADVYKLEWTKSTDADGDSITYILYAGTGIYPAVEEYDTTSTSVLIPYQEFLQKTFEQIPMLSRATVKFSVSATDGWDTVKVTGDDRVLFVNRYEYLSTVSEGIPNEFGLHENYPNPFNPTTTLRFDLPEVSYATVTIFNMLGQKVRTFNMNNTPAGYHSIMWDATNNLGEQVGAGVYLYQLRANQYVKTRKMVLLK